MYNSYFRSDVNEPQLVKRAEARRSTSPGCPASQVRAEHAHAELEIIRHQFVKGFASAPVNLALPLRMGSPWWRFCLREPAAGLVVAGGDLFDKIDNAAPQFWILDPREVSHERQSVGGREKVVDVCRAVFTRSRYPRQAFEEEG